MTMPAITQTTLAGSAPTDFSWIGLFMHADIVVKIVMFMLIMASVWSWAIIFDKLIKLKKLRAQADAFEKRFWSGKSLEELFEQSQAQAEQDPMSKVFVTAMHEWRRAISKKLISENNQQISLQKRIEKLVELTIQKEMEHIERFTSFLASTGATAPFVGLFGTVWGIMNSFKMIGQTQATSLSVVAPGIAEALFATAIGLVAAIPAVLAYNKISNDIGRYASRLEFFSAELMSLLSRQLDEYSTHTKKAV